MTSLTCINMPPKLDDEAARNPPPATISPNFLKEVLQRSTTATQQATQASQQATKAMQDTLQALPALLAQAIAKNPVTAAPTPTPTSSPTKKVPDFWESKPTSWFMVFENHLKSNPNHTEASKFALLLPLLTTNAVNKVDRLVKAPPANVYTVAKEKLLTHFERDLMDMVAELAGLSSFGDMSAVDFLEYMRSLQPGEHETRLFRHIFMRSVPAHVISAVAHHNDLDDMAKAIDVALRASPSSSSSAVDSSALSVNALSADHPRDKLVDGLCAIHAKYGKESFHCLLNTCKMKNVIKKRSGNASAGRK